MKLKRYLSFLLTASILMSIFCFTVSAAELSNSSGLSVDTVYSGNDLGATYSKSQTLFKVWSPTATQVVLNRYSTGSNSEYGARSLGQIAMKLNKTTGVWSCTIAGDIANTYYTYSVTVNGRTNETQDVYSKATGINGERSMVVDLDATDPTDWDYDDHVLCAEQTDAVIWELHVRDFSISATSGVPDEYKGKYLAFTQGGTRVNGDSASDAYSCMDYLVEQGIKYVHLNPVYDFGSVDETKPDENKYNWGYDPVNYNVPDGSYSTNPYDGSVRIKEFKQMVQALHDRNIGVIMDVVYNHTYSNDSCFQITVPNYYYRFNADGSYSNGSGCGNETRSEAPMFRKYMADSVTYWAEEYHIDGFRFDLMGLHDISTMNTVRNALDCMYSDGSGKMILMYGEPWTGGDSTLNYYERTIKENASGINERIAFFNNIYRDAVKGSAEGGDGAFVQGSYSGKNALLIKASMLGNISNPYFYNDWSAKAPTQNVLYTSAHDNYTLFDKFYASTNRVNSYTDYSSTAEQLTMLSQTMTLLGQGMAFSLAGEEFCRTKNGMGNSYNSPDSINAINWERTEEYSRSAAYYKGLIEIRNAYSPFSDGTNTSSQNMYYSHSNVPEGCIAYTLANNTANKNSEWNMAAVLINTNSCAVNIQLENSVALPDSWSILANGTESGLESLGTIKGNYIVVPACSSMVLADTASVEALNISAKTKAEITVNHVDKTTGKLLMEQKINYKVGDTFRVTPDNSLSFYYNFAGTHDKTTGLVKKTNSDITFYYEETSLYKGTITVKYLDENGKNIKATSVKRITENEFYNCKPAIIQGYSLDTAKMPANMAGVFGKEDIVMVFTYKSLSEDSITVHYSNIKGWQNVYFYCFSDNGEAYLGAWPGKRITDTDENGWFVTTVTGISEAKFIFNDGKGNQDSSGYDSFGEVYIDNGNVTFDSHVVISYIDADGNKLADDDIVSFPSSTKNSTYVTEPKEFDGYVDIVIPENYSGYCKAGYTNVVYMYSKENISHANPMPVQFVRIARGDSTHDGNVDMHDVVHMQRCIASICTLDEVTKNAADVDLNGTVTMSDIVLIQQYIAGLLIL